MTMRVITLGTAGGPRWRTGRDQAKRAGIATAIEIGDAVYLVDCGLGAAHQMMLAGLDLARLRGVFLTHLHSDHVVDLPSFVLFGPVSLPNFSRQIPLIGPGDRGALPPTSPHAAVPPSPVSPDCPTPGTRVLFDRIVDAYATDINDRVLNALRPSPAALYDPREIVIPDGTGYSPNENPCPDMEPFPIFEDETVRVSAILVSHPPLTPAFGFRFDSEYGSVTISGDTGPCENVVRLARGSDLLLHEAIDFAWIEAEYSRSGAEFAAASMDHHHRSHTSAAEAVDIALRAEVGALALHHLVPAFRPTPEWLADADARGMRVLVPEDLDVVDVSTLPVPR